MREYMDRDIGFREENEWIICDQRKYMVHDADPGQWEMYLRQFVKILL